MRSNQALMLLMAPFLVFHEAVITQWNEWHHIDIKANITSSDIESKSFVEGHFSSNLVRMSDETITTLQHQINSSDYSKNIPNDVERIDLYHITKHIYFYWAWHNGNCYGIMDSNWKSSNGQLLGQAMKNEINRLKNFGFLLSKRHGVAIDIGAHVGDTTIPMSFFASKTIAFDPSSYSYKVLKLNSVINSHLNIDAYNMAIGVEDGNAEFSYGLSTECNGGMLNEENSPDKNSVKVMKPVVNLKKFLFRNYGKDILEDIVYIKMDCEGYDFNILSSLFSMIEDISILKKPVLQVEYFDGDKRKADENDGILTPRILSIMLMFTRLSGNYSVYCTTSCNSIHNGCPTPIIEVVVNENKLTNKMNMKAIVCPDLMAIPYYRKDRVKLY